MTTPKFSPCCIHFSCIQIFVQIYLESRYDYNRARVVKKSFILNEELPMQWKENHKTIMRCMHTGSADLHLNQKAKKWNKIFCEKNCVWPMHGYQVSSQTEHSLLPFTNNTIAHWYIMVCTPYFPKKNPPRYFTFFEKI